MEKNISYFFIGFIVFSMLPFASAHAFDIKELCKYKEFTCYRVKKGDTWEKHWPNSEQREMVMRLNRTNLPLNSHTWIVVPKNLAELSPLDLAPFPSHRNTGGQKLVLVDLNKLAYGAYDQNGQLVRWGPASGGRDYCEDIDEPCSTPAGNYAITVKKGADCFSTAFPVDTEGGAPMPYCMFFHEGYALHGANYFPSYNASHGCVHLYNEDAQWLNEQFTDIGTKVTIINDQDDNENATDSGQ
ncbi:MAG: L,D-transpeptidase [Proteobacteria bacterium]|nr:L,D-transpeptidase [Pseudomonadota bacterium]